MYHRMHLIPKEDWVMGDAAERMLIPGCQLKIVNFRAFAADSSRA